MLFSAGAAAAERLPALSADTRAVTVSGLSSGGYMAVQYQVAHSASVAGAAVLAAGPYDCAQGSIFRATGACMAPGGATPPPSAADTRALIERRAREGVIDDPDGLRDDRVWLYSGGADRTVDRSVVDAAAAFYRGVLPESALVYVKPPNAGHALPTAVYPQARECPESEPPYLNRCEKLGGAGLFDAPGELLAQLLGSPGPEPAVAGTMFAFDQRAFVSGRADDAGLATEGFVYVPAACRGGGCRVHVAFHGCRQNAEAVGRRFVEFAGYNRWADRFGLIVLYPQTTARYGFAWGSWRWLYNPKACWDWWGYTDARYATREGVQIRALRAMIAHLGTGGN